MFEREVDWQGAATVICDVMRGTSALSVETHSSQEVGGQRQTHSSKWRYEQTRPFTAEETTLPRLFTFEQLRGILGRLAEKDICHAYEIKPTTKLGPDMAASLGDFSAIQVCLVVLEVGDIKLSWALVSFDQPRDLILWKMRYHLRDNVL